MVVLMVKSGSIEFWLNRVAEEECRNAKDLINNASTRNWQSLNFSDMNDYNKEKIVGELIEAMRKLGWDKEADEVSEKEY